MSVLVKQAVAEIRSAVMDAAGRAVADGETYRAYGQAMLDGLLGKASYGRSVRTRLVSIGNSALFDFLIFSFFISTMLLRATSSAVAISSSLPTDLLLATSLAMGFTVSLTLRISLTRWLITASLTFPAFTESSRA